MALVRSSKSSKSSKPKSSNNLTIKPQDKVDIMMPMILIITHDLKVDIHGVQRATCTNCSECPQFISVSGHVLCAYCGCPPAKHIKVGFFLVLKMV